MRTRCATIGCDGRGQPRKSRAGSGTVFKESWTGILAPAGTPKAIVDRIHAVLVRPLKDPVLRKQMDRLGNEMSGDGPAEYAAFINSEMEKWARVARAAGIKPE